MIDLTQALLDEGYRCVKRLDGGIYAGVFPQLYTCGLFVGLTRGGWERRYCYENTADAEKALREWNGAGDPPGPWIKEKPGDRLGPGVIGHENFKADK